MLQQRREFYLQGKGAEGTGGDKKREGEKKNKRGEVLKKEEKN